MRSHDNDVICYRSLPDCTLKGVTDYHLWKPLYQYVRNHTYLFVMSIFFRTEDVTKALSYIQGVSYGQKIVRLNVSYHLYNNFLYRICLGHCKL